MAKWSYPFLLSLYIQPESVLCTLCPKSNRNNTVRSYISCDSCCGPQGDPHCCEDETTIYTDSTTPAQDWWIVGVSASVAVILVIIFTVTLLICTKKKMERRILQSRERTVMQVNEFCESSFSARPTLPPPYTRDAPSDRPPSYRSHRSRSARSARRSARYASDNFENNSRRLPPSDHSILPNGRPPEYSTIHLPETDITTSQNSPQPCINVANGTTFSHDNIVSPPPAYSRHAFL